MQVKRATIYGSGPNGSAKLRPSHADALLTRESGEGCLGQHPHRGRQIRLCSAHDAEAQPLATSGARDLVSRAFTVCKIRARRARDGDPARPERPRGAAARAVAVAGSSGSRLGLHAASPQLLLLDEPTAALTEARRNWSEIHALAHDGLTRAVPPTISTRPSAVMRSPTSPGPQACSRTGTVDEVIAHSAPVPTPSTAPT